MGRTNASTTARERARAELTREIKQEARRQLAVAGAESLSLRAVARSLGMVSSALYRYFPSRDDLLTALIIDAYNSMGAAVEAAANRDGDARSRWAAACHAVRSWARQNPHEYALIYGSPVPGYRAPEATVGPAARMPLTFVGIVRDAIANGAVPGGTGPGGAGPGGAPAEEALAEQAARLTAALDASVPPQALVRCVIALTQLSGMVSFELFGQFAGSFDPADAFFACAVTQMAAFIGL